MEAALILLLLALIFIGLTINSFMNQRRITKNGCKLMNIFLRGWVAEFNKEHPNNEAIIHKKITFWGTKIFAPKIILREHDADLEDTLNVFIADKCAKLKHKNTTGA